MSIYSDEQQKKLKNISWAWERAALDVSIPSRLIERQAQSEWRNYLECLSPAQQLRKLGQALDQFLELMKKVTDPLELPENDQIKLYSKWEAANIAAVIITKRLAFASPEEYTCKSDMDRYLFSVVNLMKGVNSADASKWEDRRAQYNEINKDVLYPLLTEGDAIVRRINSPPKRPSGPAV